jgi:SAM-dependent methyltransferase
LRALVPQARHGARATPGGEGGFTERQPSQDPDSAAQNAGFFAKEKHAQDVARLDTYARIREAIEREIAGCRRLLDVGNGGVFQYDTELIEEIVAVDLFLDRLPASQFPANVTPRQGDALDLDEPDNAYDGVLEALLYHHLVGARADDLVDNVRLAIAEAARVLAPGGRLIVVESCVPQGFYRVERIMFGSLVRLAKTPVLGGHPATLQLPVELLLELVGERLDVVSAYRVPPGRWTTQFGRRWPTALTPARAFMVVGRKSPPGRTARLRS